MCWFEFEIVEGIFHVDIDFLIALVFFIIYIIWMCKCNYNSLSCILQVMKEAMRIYTTTPVVARELSEDMTLGGYFLPKVSESS